ncbi:MAG: uL15m family ribosomal protein [Candidatus Woesearchaeota archaeon]|jgi:large subunit ribosomal protein L15|nr:uL15m family ribosomal protein [Candidatus Woesearchaeota archaeon]MDP7324216.1 uL15m family ribosomal protein [Candidatus Woesearchaeota archaeon]MDP7457961.1 uL15m family ribosomal protein [Candidatus Woesearchaeota archaeon]|tara:strand:+ start:729 stop:1187 length:459 start_codon:yes stop_codon:yes gene_type:complete
MVTFVRKKNSRQRGTKTHGCGSMKKRRGKGNKGGSGRAGTGKRADQAKPSVWNSSYFGKHGFHKKNTIKEKTINIIDLEFRDALSKKEQDTYTVDLTAAGYTKLLSRGKVSKKFKITVKRASKKAIDKIQQAGGVVELLTKKAQPAKEEVAK